MTLAEKLKKLISDNVDNARPFFAWAIAQNEDFTWQVQPIDGSAIIYSAQTFQEEADGNAPTIGSLVLCIYIDQFSCFITEIIDYDTYFVNSETSSTMYSANNAVIAGKRTIILGEEKTVEEVKEIVDNIQNNGDTGVLVESKNIRLEAKENDAEITIKSDGKVLIYGTQVGIDGASELDLTSNGAELGNMLADIGNTLTDIQTALLAINAAFIGTGTPTPLSTIPAGVILPPTIASLSTQITNLVTNINLWNAN